MKDKQARITVHVQPGSRKNQIVGFEDGALKIKISAPPVKGKANKALIEFIGEVVDISKGSITIEKGLTSKRKQIVIDGLDQDELTNRLNGL